MGNLCLISKSLFCSNAYEGNSHNNSNSLNLKNVTSKLKSIFILIFTFIAFSAANAQVANYTFVQSSNAYTPITGTNVGTATWDDNLTTVTIPFTFTYNNLPYTTCSVNSNGYLTFGTTTSSSTGYTPISATTGYAGAVSAFARDLINNATAITTTTLNTTPNRIFVVQWNSARRYNSGAVAGDVFNFQIRLYETSNKVEIMYGTCTATSTTALTHQVGLRGASNADYNNRTSATNWSATTAGASNSATITSSNTILPASGLTFTWTPGAAPTPPSNDNCIGATSLTVNSGTTCLLSTNGTSLAATQSQVSCAGTADDDVWYSFVATSSSHTVTVTPLTLNDAVLQGFSGSCGSLTSLGCTDNSSGSSIETATYSGLTVGNTYYVRVHSYGNGTGNGTFSICVTTPPPPPSNDNCLGAIPFPAIPLDGSCATLSNQSTLNATASGVTPTGVCTSNSGTPDDDVWFSFVAPASTVILSATNVSGATDVYWHVFSSACASSMVSVLCTDNNTGGTITGLTAGNTYYIRLYTWSSAVSTVQNICLSTPPPPPANDNCSGAIGLTVDGLTCTSPTNGTTVAATQSQTSCAGTADDDVWYSFVATSTSHSVTVTPTETEVGIVIACVKV